VDQPNSWIRLSSPELNVEINPLGAQLSILRDQDGHDLLWDGDPAVWSGRAPLLFPIVGELAGGSYRLDGRTYKLSRHGFARGKMFEVVAPTAAAATFNLRANEATLQLYPFNFELNIRYALQGPTLVVTTSVHNRGTATMPASFGYHPGLRWPLPYGRARAEHFIEFANEEPAPIRRLNSVGLLTDEPHPTPIVARRLGLNDSLFQNDVVIFDQVRSRCVTYGAQAGPRIRMSYPDSPYLGVWTKPGAGFICIEPWHGIADPAGFAGEFTEKPGVFAVPPGGVRQIEMSLTLLRG